MFTVITEGNKVRQYTDIDSIECSVEGPFLAISNRSGSKVAFTEISPITWPADVTNGLQAIVDVKAGTLRFGWGPVSGGFEFVVSEYVAPEPHVFDLIDCWPDQRNKEPSLDAPEGWGWKYLGDDWVLSNGLVGLNHDAWFKYKFVDPQPVKPFVSVEDCDLSVPVKPKAPVTKEEVMALVDMWPHDDNIPVNRDIANNWIWSRKSNKNVIINLVDNVNSGVVITESDWREHLVEILRKNPPIIGTKHDPVNHPSHYTDGGIECIDAIKASMSTEAFLGFLKGNVQKYMWRYEKKVAPVEDLKKAQWYLSKLIDEQE